MRAEILAMTKTFLVYMMKYYVDNRGIDLIDWVVYYNSGRPMCLPAATQGVRLSVLNMSWVRSISTHPPPRVL